MITIILQIRLTHKLIRTVILGSKIYDSYVIATLQIRAANCENLISVFYKTSTLSLAQGKSRFWARVNCIPRGETRSSR